MTIKENICSITGKITFSINQVVKGKNHSFHTVNHDFDWNETKYQYRAITKCRAGFMTISDGTATLQQAVCHWKKNALQTLEVKLPDSDFYVTVLAIKGGKFVLVENSILENMTIGTIHSQFPAMADYGHWKHIGSKTWAGLAYGKLEDSFKNLVVEMV